MHEEGHDSGIYHREKVETTEMSNNAEFNERGMSTSCKMPVVRATV